MRIDDADLAKVLRANPDLREANSSVKAAPPLEHDEQCELMRLCALFEHQHQELALLFAIPNGGKRDTVTAVKMVQEGVKAGVPDLMFPVARGGYHGMFIELKRAGNKPTPVQLAWHGALLEQGYRVLVCYSAEAAFDALCAYLGMA